MDAVGRKWLKSKAATSLQVWSEKLAVDDSRLAPRISPIRGLAVATWSRGRASTRFPALEQAVRLTSEFTAHTTAETGLQDKPRDTLQQTFQVPSAEALPFVLQISCQVPCIALRVRFLVEKGEARRLPWAGNKKMGE